MMSKWITPSVKQGFVTMGVAMNMAGAGMVLAITAGLLPQLRRPESEIQIDEFTGSWIAASPGISFLLGNLLIPIPMSRLGRKISNIFSAILFIIGWLTLALAKNITIIILARLIQGAGLGASLALGSILVGEYTSPKKRGFFLIILPSTSASYVLIGHIISNCCIWQNASLIAMTLSIVSLLIIMASPESPTWLASQGRYEDCRTVFRWLRGNEEEEELGALIKASMNVKEAKSEKVITEKSARKSFRVRVIGFYNVITKKEFYKPIFIMFHLFTLCNWAGVNIICSFTMDIFEVLIGKNENITLHIAVMDIQRVVSNLIAIFIVKRMKRRTMFISLSSLNVFSMFATAAYVYAKQQNLFESSVLGFALIHLQVFTIATCTVPLPFVIAGEIFPRKYKEIAGGISMAFYALNLIVNAQTAPFLFRTIGIHGAYCLYAAVVSYCVLISFLFLPETKDRTLQDIEKEFAEKGKQTLEELKSVESLIITNG